MINHKVGQEQDWRVIGMEIRSRLGLGGKTHRGVVAGLGVVSRRVGQIRLPSLKEGIPVEMFASSYLPYKAEKTYRTIMIEFECRRGQTLVEVQKHLARGL
jgi:hypothetical protein